MATKRAGKSKAKAPRKISNGAGKGPRLSAGVDLGPIVVAKIRVPINEKVYQKKESELAQLEVEIAKKKRSIAPTQNEIRQLRKRVAGLTVDIEQNTEERDEHVRHKWNHKTNEVQIFRASDMKLVEKRTMTLAERKRTLDIEDERFGGKRSALPEEPTPSAGDSGLAPVEAIAAARDGAESEDDPEQAE